MYLNRATKLASNPKNCAYILVKCEPGFEQQVLNSLKETKGVVQVDQVYGSLYDIVVELKCDGLKQLNSAVWRIRRLSGIRFTQTLLVGNFV